jgi:hypothetical protein
VAARDAVSLRYWDGQRLLSDEGAPEYSYERSRYAFEDATVAAVFKQLKRLPAGTASWKAFLTVVAVERHCGLPTATASGAKYAIR